MPYCNSCGSSLNSSEDFCESCLVTFDQILGCLHVLELEAGASEQQIRQAFRDLSKVWHPDRFERDQRMRARAQEKFCQINDAYHTLMGERHLLRFVEGCVRRTPPTADPKSDSSGRTDREFNLKNVTPHLLAVGMLQQVRERGNMWRTPDIEIPQEADAIVAIACEYYELRIFIDLLKQRFGSGISKLVEASFASVVDGVDGLAMFSRVNAAISYARRLGPATKGPENPKLRLDLQVADQILSLFRESDEQKQAVRFPLAQLLGYARISAEQFFPGLVAKIDFDPLSITFVARETEYKGTTNRWSEMPGCFERYLQRKEDNFLFPISERQPTEGAIREARAKDGADLERLQKNITAFFRSAERFRDQKKIAGEVMVDFLRTELDPLMRRADEIGEPARREFKTLEELRDRMLKICEAHRAGSKSEIEALKKVLQGQFNLFLAQTWRSDTPIRAEEITPAFLCESTDTIRGAVEVLQQNTPETVRILYQSSVTLLKDAAEQGFELPGAEEKLALLRACSEGTESTSTA